MPPLQRKTLGKDIAMSLKIDISDSVERASQSVVKTSPWIERLARVGYSAKGFVYLLVGLLAIQAAFGLGGETTGTEGALKAIQRQPFGQILLILTAAGLVGYTVWRFTQALFDPDHNDSNSPKRIFQRIGYAASAIAYALLTWEAIRMVMGFASSSGGQDSTESSAAQLMTQPFGPWLVGIVGAVVIGVGLFQTYYGITAQFLAGLKLHQMNDTERTWATRSGRWGYSARGIIYTIIGGFLIWAGIQLDPDEAVGMEEAFDKVAQQPFGAWLLALIAMGFMAYAAFAFVQARYRNIEVDDVPELNNDH